MNTSIENTATHEDLLDLIKYKYISIELIKRQLPDNFFDNFTEEDDELLDTDHPNEVKITDLMYYLPIPLVWDGDEYCISCILGTPNSLSFMDGSDVPTLQTTQIEFNLTSNFSHEPKIYNITQVREIYTISTADQAKQLLTDGWAKFVDSSFDKILNHKIFLMNNLSIILDEILANPKCGYTQAEIKKMYSDVFGYLPTQLADCRTGAIGFDHMELDCLGRKGLLDPI